MTTTKQYPTIEDYPKPGQRVRFIGCDQMHSGRTGTVRDVHEHPTKGCIVVNLDLDATANRRAHGCLFTGFAPEGFGLV